MSGIASVFFVIAALLIWGGLVASAVFLILRPEVAAYPAGGDDGDGTLYRIAETS
ncbi:MAG: MetS family NSS transporter small subunit [Parahaliea sp.]